MKGSVSPGLAIGAAAVTVFAVLALVFGFTVVSTEEEASLNVEFDPVTYVADSWDDVQTVIRDEAVPLADVLNRIAPDAAGKATTESLTPIAEELGHITTGNAHVYRVNASGTVTDVDTETSRGTLGLTVDGYEGPILVRVYVGSRIPSDESSIRDATGFIEFGDFREQTEYGKVAAEINKKVLENIEAVDVEALVGQPVTVTGAFTLRTQNQPSVDVSQISIVPIETQGTMSAPLDATVAEEAASPSADGVPMRAEHITKVFPGTTALDDVTFDVHAGKVNVLVGENGAGKSTLMKILAGVEQPTSGRVLMDGQPVELPSVTAAAQHGVGIIFQELNLCANLSVLDNLFLAQELVRGVAIDRRTERGKARELLARLEQDIDPDEIVTSLRIGQQQIVEIAKALTHDVRVLIMDEPTSALSQAEVQGLFRIIRDLKARGVSIVYISHKLEELLQIGDRITVLRDGRVVAHAEAAEVDVPWIIEQMVGRSAASLFSRTVRETGETLLRVVDVTLPRLGGGYLLDHVSLELHAGEVLGLYGLMGAGRTELMEVLAGVRPEASGEVWLGERRLDGASVADRIEAGIVLVPEDRKTDGLVATLSVAHNMVLASLRRYLNRFFLSRGKERSAVDRMIEDLSVRVASPNANIGSLSGGNQQKVVVAKGLLTEPKVLLLDEPTRGIDVGAKSEIFQITSRLAAEGYGILFVSSELKEVMALCDRILVLSKGVVVAELDGDRATERELVDASAVGHGPVRLSSQPAVPAAATR